MMIKISLPDGSIKEMPNGSNAFDIAKSISEGLARNILSASVNKEIWDINRPITFDCSLKLPSHLIDLLLQLHLDLEQATLNIYF